MRAICSALVVALLPISDASVGVSVACDPHTGIEADHVYNPGDEGFDVARMDQYAKYLGTKAQASAKLNPAMVVKCSEESHVQSAMRFAAKCGYKVSVRSGGHSYTGCSTCNFAKCMQLDLQAMTKASVSGHMITAQPGIRLIDFAKFTLRHFLSVPHGACTQVGMGGHLQSSAWGMLSHSFGSGLDWVDSFRMVLADGSVQQYSRHDANNTVYHSVLGSAPGSWGIITQFVLEGIPDTKAPFTRVISVRLPFSRKNALVAMKQTQFIAQDQEARHLRDMKILLVISPPTEQPDTEVYITVFALWTGVDSGYFGSNWRKLYMQPFWDLDYVAFPHTADVPMDLSGATRLMSNLWTNHHDRYAVEAMHSDYWWKDDFFELIATELEERVAMIPDVYPSWQFLPLGSSSQWALNADKNSLTWRDTRQYVDDWMFVKNDTRYEEVVQRMRNFREKNRKHWEFSDGSDRSTWMSPSTIYENATDLRIESVSKSYFANRTLWNKLQLVKAELDPTDMLSTKCTIPLPGHVLEVV